MSKEFKQFRLKESQSLPFELVNGQWYMTSDVFSSNYVKDAKGFKLNKEGGIEANELTTESFKFIRVSASDALKASADTERSTGSGSYTKLKEIIINLNGTIKTKFDLKSNTGGLVNGRIYVNGSAVGTEQSTTSTNYTTYTENITVKDGDLVQVYAKDGGAGALSTVSNFRLYFDKSLNTETVVNTD